MAGAKELFAIFSILWVFASIAFIFPLLQDACSSYTGKFQTLVQAIPLIVLGISSIFPIILWKETK